MSDTSPAPHELPPDALLTTLGAADPHQLRHLLADATVEPPRIVTFATEDRDAPLTAIDLGAADALAALDAVTVEDVQRVAQDILGSGALNLALIGPFEDADRFEQLLAKA